MIISQIYFDVQLYMFRTDLLSVIRSLVTVYTAICICHTVYADYLLADSQHKYITIHTVSRLLMVDSKSVRNCRFLYQNKVEKYCIFLASFIRRM